MLDSTRHRHQPRRGVTHGSWAWLLVLGATAGQAQPATDPTTALVTVTRAYAVCLIDTATLPRQQAIATADGFLRDHGVSSAQRSAIERSEQFTTHLRAYIQQRGGCRQLVMELLQ